MDRAKSDALGLIVEICMKKVMRNGITNCPVCNVG